MALKRVIFWIIYIFWECRYFILGYILKQKIFDIFFSRKSLRIPLFRHTFVALLRYKISTASFFCPETFCPFPCLREPHNVICTFCIYRTWPHGLPSTKIRPYCETLRFFALVLCFGLILLMGCRVSISLRAIGSIFFWRLLQKL